MANSVDPGLDLILMSQYLTLRKIYSIYIFFSSPLVTPGSVEFVFNVVDIDHCCGRTYSRKGVCTGWLEKFETCKESSEDTKVSNCCDVPVVRKVG